MLDLLDYRRRVAEMYQNIRAEADPYTAWTVFRQQRADLFKTHPQSALTEAQQAVFTVHAFYEYDPAFRVVARADYNVEPQLFEIDLGDDGTIVYRRFGQVSFRLPTGTGRLSLFWIMGYGGGVFMPFGDATNRATTYGGGRYLYDTIKGADLGTTLDGDMVLDFNFAYNPSCAYSPRWTCPLSPIENKLAFPIPVGEQKP